MVGLLLYTTLLAPLIYLLQQSIYRLFFHPLAKYPGPFLARITQWPEAISSWRFSRHMDIYRLHQQYGDIVRISPNSLSFRTAQAWHDIYTDRHANVVKSGWTDAAAVHNPYNTQIMSDRKLHAARRKILNHAFSDAALKGMEDTVLRRIEQLLKVLEQPKPHQNEGGWSQALDMAAWFTYLTQDILGDLCFGDDFGNLKNGGSVWIAAISASAERITRFAFLPFRSLFAPFFSDAFLSAMGNKLNAQFMASAGASVQKRFEIEAAEQEKSEQDRRKDFFHYLMHGANPETGEKFAQQELVGEAILLIVAGSDTSSTALAATLFYLMHNRGAMDRLQGEVCGSFDNIDQIRPGSAEVNKLQYLRACIDEAMRLSPPVPTLMSRQVLSGGIEIDGIWVPESTVVGVPIYALHHNERYFEHCHRYVPERWILDSTPAETEFRSNVTKESLEKAKSAFVPFSTGPRGCVGKNMANMELLVTMARLVYQFDMRLTASNVTQAGVQHEYVLQDTFVSKRSGPYIEFKRR